MLFISNAYAQSSEGFSFGGMGSFLPIIILFAVLYFLLIRPQQKKAKEQKDMANALTAGDEVLTISGLIGRVVDTNESFVLLEIARDTRISVQKTAIVSMLPNGTLDTLWNKAPEEDEPETPPASPDSPAQ